MPDHNEFLREQLREVIKQVVHGTRITVEEIEKGFLLDVPVEYDILVAGKTSWKEKRRQFVYVTCGRKTMDEKDLFQVFTICAPEDPRYYRSALQLNMNMSQGAFGISQIEVVNQHLKRNLLTYPSGSSPSYDVEQRNYFVMVETFLVEGVSPLRMRKSILALANAGDQMEKLLTGKDIS